jgi:hypothetical protein
MVDDELEVLFVTDALRADVSLRVEWIDSLATAGWSEAVVETIATEGSIERRRATISADDAAAIFVRLKAARW